jgi:hypothetical protein
MTRSPRKLRVHKDLVLILPLQVSTNVDLPATIPSSMIKGYPWIIRELAEVEEVETVEMEVEMEARMVILSSKSVTPQRMVILRFHACNVPGHWARYRRCT